MGSRPGLVPKPLKNWASVGAGLVPGTTKKYRKLMRLCPHKVPLPESLSMSNLDLDRLNHVKKYYDLPPAAVLHVEGIPCEGAWQHYTELLEEFETEEIPSVLNMWDFSEKDLHGEGG